MTETLIIANYARTGGTLLNRILAADSRLVCLSEINSRFICPTLPNTVSLQLKKWYQIDIEESTPLQEIVDLRALCYRQNKNLIIRDWSFGSFVPLKYNNHNPPTSLNTIDDLSERFPCKVIGLVRNPIDVWLSMRYSSKTFHDKLLIYYLQFVEDLLKRNVPVIKYEDLTNNPEEIVSKLYKSLDIKLPVTLGLSENVTGDINFTDPERTFEKNLISKNTRRFFTQDEMLFIKEKTESIKILNLLNYGQDW